MNDFTLPSNFSTTPSATSLPYTGLRPGHHRALAKEKEDINTTIAQVSQEIINQPQESDKTTRTRSQYVGEFLRKIENMELEFKEITFIQARCKETTKLKEKQANCTRLKSKYNEIIASTKRAPPDTAQSFVAFQQFMQMLKPDEELVLIDGQFKIIKKGKDHAQLNQASLDALKNIIKLVLDSLEHGINSYDSFVNTADGKKEKATISLLEILMQTGMTAWAQNLICRDKEVYFAYNNVFILAISKNLSNLFPRDSELENQFLDIIADISKNEDPSGVVISQEYWIKDFQPKLHDFVRKIANALNISTRLLSKKLSEQTEPKFDKIIGIPNLSVEPIFFELDLIDEKNPFEAKKKSISAILKEIATTESVLHNKTLLLTKKIWPISSKNSQGNFFESLQEYTVIDPEFCSQLTFHFEELSKTSHRLIENFSQSKSLINHMEACLISFSPQIIHSHLKHLKFLSGAYTKTDEIIKNCLKNEQTNQKLQEFKHVNKTDIIDILIMPVQRAPRYVLLLNELAKQFDSIPIKNTITERINYLQRWIESINYLVDPNSIR